MPDIVIAERLAEIEAQAETSRKHRGVYWNGDIPDLCATVRKLKAELVEERARLDAKCREEKIEVLREIQSIALAWWIANSYEQILHRGFGETILAEKLRNEIARLEEEQRTLDAAREKADEPS